MLKTPKISHFLFIIILATLLTLSVSTSDREALIQSGGGIKLLSLASRENQSQESQPLVFSLNDNLIPLKPPLKTTKVKGGKYTLALIETDFRASHYNVVEITLRVEAPRNKSRKIFRKRKKGLPSQDDSAPSIHFGWQCQADSKFPAYQKIVNLLVTSDENWKIYRFYPGENPLWRDRINGLCVEVSSFKRGVDIKEIRLFSHNSQLSQCPQRMKIGNQTRPATLIQPNCSLTQKKRLYLSSGLEFGMQLINFKTGSPEYKATFTLFIKSSWLTEQTLVEHTFTSQERSKVKIWKDFNVDLSSYKGKEVRLRWQFDISSSEEQSVPESLFFAVSQPYLTTAVSSECDPSLLLLSIDTLRADHLGCYGYPVATSPWIDWLSRQGATTFGCITPYPFTPPAHISLMTGLYASQHGAQFGSSMLSPFIPTLAEYFLSKGKLTTAVTGGAYVSPKNRLDKGFLNFDYSKWSIQSLEGRLLPWLKNHYQVPAFIFYHTYEVHDPFSYYKPITEYYYPQYQENLPDEIFVKDLRKNKQTREELEYIKALYDSGIRVTDDKLGSLFRFLKVKDIFNRTMIVFLSDHGEHFGERQLYGHNNSLEEALLHIPLIFSYPDRLSAGNVISSTISLTDIPAIVCELLKKRFPFIKAESKVLPILSDQGVSNSCLGYSELMLKSRQGLQQFYALKDNHFKYLVSKHNSQEQLFSLPTTEDPEDNVINEHHKQASVFRNKLNDMLEFFSNSVTTDAQEARIHDPAIRDQLRAMGYID
ncbi:sulfatase-like hydrolase/transferase [candidate division CSSED10-310 bacterium]|uniref:Sulfatase-like hydrolase/transferase n=1 Tax=candidate division CSSED10-310 bacterium TaxID=2855610 RepID=A0ABV6YUF5_UNCC1